MDLCISRFVLINLARINVEDRVQLASPETIDRVITSRKYTLDFVEIRLIIHKVVIVAHRTELACVVNIDQLEWSGANAIIAYLIFGPSLHHHQPIFSCKIREFGIWTS